MKRNKTDEAVVTGVSGCGIQKANRLPADALVSFADKVPAPVTVITESSVDTEVSVEIFAPDSIPLPSEPNTETDTMKLSLTVRLRNHR